MKPSHVAVVLSHVRFKPTPDMTPLEVAYYRGREARMLGEPEHGNPYGAGQLAEEWTRGYTDGRR